MRPISLEIEGLQSFKEKQSIDFETLGETGLFGIFGPTGSGKSTILDAITFALFGDVRRAKNGTQGIININCKTMRVSFTFELLKDGTRKRYRVERVSQKKKDSDNIAVTKIARLMELTGLGDVPICDKATDVTNKVTELIGLNKQDFTRAVVLPQNSFHEFLLMNNADRRRMLERIFYLEEYGKLLSDKLNRKIDRLRSCMDTLSGELRGYQDASDEALKEAGKAMEAAAAEKEKALKLYKELELEYNQAKEVWELVKEMADIEEREKHHASSAQEIADARAKLDRADKAARLIEPIRKHKDLTERLKKINVQLAEVQGKLPSVRADLLRYQKSYGSLKKERALKQPELVARKARLEDALSLKDEIDSLKKKLESLTETLTRLKDATEQKNLLIGQETEEYERLVAEADRLKKEWHTLVIDPEYRKHIQEGVRLEDEGVRLEKDLKGLENEHELLIKMVSESEVRLEQTRKAIDTAIEEAEALTGKKAHHERMLQENKNNYQKKAQELQDIKGIFRVIQLRQDQIRDLKSRMDNAGLLLEKAEKRNQLLIKARDEAEVSCEKYRLQLIEAESMLDRDAALRLAGQLKEGVACPVCGSEHHPKPAHRANLEELSELESRVGEIRSRLEDADKALRDAEADLLINGEQLKAAKLQHDEAREILKAQTRELELERQKLPDALKSLDTDDLATQLEGLERELNLKQKELEDGEKTLSDLSERLKKLNETLSEKRALESGILSEIKLGRERVMKTERSLKETRKLWEENHKKVSRFLAEWSISSIRDEMDRLDLNDQRAKAVNKELDLLNQQIGLRESRIGELKEELQAESGETIKCEAEMSHLKNELRTKQIRIHQITGGSDMEDEIRRIKDKLEEYETTERSLEDKIKNLETGYQNLQNEESLLLSQKKTIAEDMRDDEDRINKALVEMGFKDPDDVEKALLSEEESDARKARIEEYERAGIRIQADKERIANRLNARTITEEGWEEISKAWREALASREASNSEYDIAAHHYQNTRTKHQRWLELTRELEETNKKMSLYEQIRKLLGGNRGKDNSFIDYIAEERLRYVAARATETLGIMTRYKYALELDADNGFVIRDNANGGVYRMVTSLSGGETFLTSLSLALALSEQIQLKGQSPLEFFFLDEGFGTLDRSLLDNVMDSLERISKKERMIGLISHVPELRGRIARRLMVEPPASAGEGTRVWIEKA